MLLFRLYFWSHPPVMLLYMKVEFIPAEIVDAFYWPLLLVADLYPVLTARYTQITYFWWFIDWIGTSALHAGTKHHRRLSASSEERNPISLSEARERYSPCSVCGDGRR